MARKFMTVDSLAKELKQDSGLVEEIRQNPTEALANLAEPFQVPDTWIYRIVVIALGSAVLVSIGGAVVLAGMGKEIPQILTAIGSAAVGALAGLLAPAPPQAVN